MTPTDMQAAAIRSIVKWYRDPRSPQEYYLAGYAGTGKSTVANMALNTLQEKCGVRRTITATFTAKAADVLRKKGVPNPDTIHATFLKNEEPEGMPPVWEINEESKARDADLIMLDEVSMVNKEHAAAVRYFGKKTLVMGDPGQLPPIGGEGAFTRRDPDFFMTEIHRQAAESPILRLATMARRGEAIPYGNYGDNVCVIPLSRRTEPLIYEPHTQPLCGTNKVRWEVTQRFRNQALFFERTPEHGEKIICCRNDRKLGIYNGQIGTLDRFNGAYGAMVWYLGVTLEGAGSFQDDMVVSSLLFRQHFEPSLKWEVAPGINQFDWGYILTLHKAQGSEWPHVTVIDDSAAHRENRHKWLYTAITRASEGLTLMRRTK